MSELQTGQRWFSESEPELGLGLITEISERFVLVAFPASETERRYARRSAPLRRARFQPGDVVENREGERFSIVQVEEMDGLLVYLSEDGFVHETQLNDRLSFDTPEQRLPLGQWEEPSAFQLRLDLLDRLSRWYRSPARGLVGGRISLLPHQLYVVREAISRPQPRLLLADEAGLGKTIEACLILHHLLTVGRIQRALLILPESLVHQWFVELLRRFNLVFQIVDAAYCQDNEESDPGSNPFASRQLVICSEATVLYSPRRHAQALEAGWDMIIVDEAHHIKEGTESYQRLLQLTSNTWGTLLLTATPEQLGLESHFARLRLLDPERYDSFDSFLQQSESYQQLATLVDFLLDESFAPKKVKDLPAGFKTWCKNLGIKAAEQKTLKQAFLAGMEERKAQVPALLDRYGMGRVMFRNTRAAIEGFPVREVHLCPLAPPSSSAFSDDPRVQWLVNYLTKHREQKTVLICHSKERVEQIHHELQHTLNLPVALFHEALPLLQRDRNAAWFADPDGATLLLCSEVGGEGRNFQHAQHLVLFDVPPDPEMLEQRIGRLDRIGQEERIHIHVPYVENSNQEIWVRWFHEGLDAFSRTFPAGFRALEDFRPRLETLLSQQKEEPGAEAVQENLKQLLADTRLYCDALLEQLEQGRNRLLEQSSYVGNESETVLTEVVREENSAETHNVILRLFQHLGVEVEPHTAQTWELTAGSRLHENFPWLSDSTMFVTLDRDHALNQATSVFISLDHPMVVGAADLWLGSTSGNCSVAVWPSPSAHGLFLEAIFVLECIAPPSLNVERFLPPSPIRCVVDHNMEDVTSKYPSRRWVNKLTSDVPAQMQHHPTLFKQQVPAMLQCCREQAAPQQRALQNKALSSLEDLLVPELERLRYLQTINPDVTEQDVAWAEKELDMLRSTLKEARLRLDAIQLVLQGDFS